MRKTLLYLALLLCAVAYSPQSAAQSQSSETLSGVVRVKLQREVASRIAQRALPMNNGVVATGVTQLDRVNQKVKAVSMKRLIPYSPKFEERHKAAGLDLWYEIRFEDAGVTPMQAKNLYKTVPGIQIAENVRPMKMVGGETFRPISPNDIAKAAKAAATPPFNDPLLSQQWHYHNDGSLPGSVVGADANVWEGWKTETGKSDVLVAIIDGGYQYDHPDLQQNVLVNEAELNGQPGVDDDKNGYVDDIYGYNFVINSGDVSAHSHGTHVAGTVGAVNNNGVGVAGVAGGNGNGGVKMISCQIFDNRSGADANYAGALIYAADMGASIAQCSWGWDADGYYEQAVLDAIDYFTQFGGGEKMHGGLCIFANGNTGDEGEYYPGCYEKVVAVGAMDPLKQPASYSSYGDWCDITAPGGNEDYGEKYGVLSTLPNSTYGYNEGTSMATPHVSGIAALILSKYGSTEFTNENLRQQLVASVNDFYTDNPEVAGKFGSGYIDAFKALQMGSGAAPQPVADFTLTPSQDNVLIEWIIPDAEEKSVDHHVIYYSTEPFTPESDLSQPQIKSVTVDTKFHLSGDSMQYELGGLTPLTTYYIGIKSVNRYGNSAEMTEVKSATTNAGPEVSLNKSELSLDVDASKGQTATDEFVIDNVGKGILKYTMSAATQSATISASAANNVVPGKLVPARNSITALSLSSNPIVTADYQKEDYPKTITYTDLTGVYIGDNDLSVPNAEAQYFYVDPKLYPDGFNLTHLNIGGTYGSDPVIEVYNGASTISKASLLQTVEYDWFMYNYDLSLKEQIYFKPGSSFWVVVKFPAGQDQPLGAGYIANQQQVKQYSFYSSDNGETWTQLSEVLREGNLAEIADSLTWGIKAISKNPDWSSVLNPQPAEGTVRPGENQTVKVMNDGQKMVNGTYKYNLYLNTNETENPNKKISVNMTVTGNKPELTSAKVVDFGDLLVGQEKKLLVEIANVGYGAFTGSYGLQGDDMKCSSDQFVMPSYIQGGFPARSTNNIEITFKPTKSGSHSGTVTLTDKNGIKHTFVVRGVAAMPAKVSIDKKEFDLGDLTVGGEAKTATFTIKNEGEYPLQYVFPKYSDETIEDAGTVHKFGYSYISNLNGSDEFEYDNNPELNNETDITSQFNNNVWQSEALDLGFLFPFYGKTYSKAYVTSHGSIEMQTTDGNIQCIVPTATCVGGLGYISAFANSGKLSLGANSKITYGRQDGKFTVKFKDVLTGSLAGNGEYLPVSFHFSLCSDGSIEFFYDNYDPETVFGAGENIFVGVSDIECADPFVVTDADAVHAENTTLYKNIKTGSAIKIVAPSQSMIDGLSSTNGVINIGESKQITVTASAAEGTYAGELKNNLMLMTNDPEQPGTNIVIKANIVGDNLKPVAALDSTSVNFGDVFRTSKAVRTVLLHNNGTDVLTVKSVKAENGKITVAEDVTKEFTIAPGNGKDLAFTLPTETEGEVSDNIIVTYGDETTVTLPVRGKVIGVPEWSLSPESIDESTPYGVNINKDLTITNNGNETLKFSVEPSLWVDMTDLTSNDNSSIEYICKSASDYSDIEYNWIDLTSDPEATHQDMSYYLDKTDYYKVELPFEFPFFGKKYKTMYIYNTGFVSFSEHTDYKEFPEPPAEIPTTETFYTNIIAPFWGNHTMGTAEDDGTYYKVEDDHVVVSFVNYGNSVMIGMDYQLLLYKDGHYKFQYHLQDNGMMIGVYGLAGMQDETGTRGMQLPDQYINTGNAVEIYPVKSFSVAAGENVTIPVEIKADSLANVYNTELTFNTNVPTQPVVKLPITLNITGEAEPVFPAKVGGEAVANSYTYPELVYDFEVKNNGSKAFKLTNAEFNADGSLPAMLSVYTTYTDPWFGTTTTGWMQWAPGMQIEVGKEPVKFQIHYFDDGTPVTVNSPITFTTEGLSESTHTVPFELNLTEAPAITFDKPEIVINNVSDNYTGQETMTIKNEGKYKLTYSLRMDPNGVGETIPDTENPGGGIMPGFMNILADSLTQAQRNSFIKEKATSITPFEKFDGFIYDVPDVDCSNLLYYPIMPIENPQTLLVGTGSDDLSNNFRAATRYTAPAEGFSLTHLYFVGTIGDLENVDIEASVIGSSDVTSDRVIGHGKLRVEKEEPYSGTYFGEPRMLEFDKPVYINPNDTFYVVLKYPAGYPHSAIISAKAERVREGRYMAWFKDLGWIDLGEELYNSYSSSMGYFMTCVEMQPGKPWIKLLNDKTEGEIAVGESLPVNVEINAESTYFDRDNKAVIVIKSNDPAQPVVNYPITLNKNSAPVVTGPEGTTTVPEASTADMNITVEDLDGDAFSVTLADESGISSVAGCTITDGNETTNAEVTDNKVSVPAGKKLNVTMKLAPEYGSAGLHNVTVTATDAQGNIVTKNVPYNVEFTNRAPVYEGEQELNVYIGKNTGIIAYESVFSDPDGDAMTFTASMPDNKFAELMTNSNGYLLSGVAGGKTELTLTATDAAGAKTTVKLPVSVTDATGIGSVTTDKEVSVYPNPVIDNANVTMAESATNVNYYVYDNAGQLVKTAHADNKAAGEAQAIDMSGCAKGVYRIKVAAADRSYVVTVIKK
ncbi:S8 family serine peptidase [Prevotella sp. HCN-7019]|uniref:S8 family serine peptidase n=1 Tax=Prevotella sp. HCN-7019 TaxID=3134668 RepID=UPI0030C05C16